MSKESPAQYPGEWIAQNGQGSSWMRQCAQKSIGKKYARKPVLTRLQNFSDHSIETNSGSTPRRAESDFLSVIASLQPQSVIMSTNSLLDVGPDKHGLIPEKYIGALKRLRKNLDLYGI